MPNLPDDDVAMEFPDENSAAQYAFGKTLERARLGDPAAQYAVALVTLKCSERPDKDEIAHRWLLKAAAQGYVPAKLLLKDV